MNAWGAAMRAGLARGWIELKQTYTNAETLIPSLIVGGGFVLVMVLTRGTTVPGTHFSLGATIVVSLLGMNIGVNGLSTMGALLATEREDGTLLRAKATPNGMTGYLTGKIVAVLGSLFPSARSAGLITLWRRCCCAGWPGTSLGRPWPRAARRPCFECSEGAWQ
jgi:ABC-2 type transport system permease protein